MNAAVVPFTETLDAVHLLAGDNPLSCPRGVRVPFGNGGTTGTLYTVLRCQLTPGHDGNCQPSNAAPTARTRCGRDVTGAWINWQPDDGPPCPVCHDLDTDEQEALL